MQEFLISPLGLLLLFGWTLALFYHFWSGLRHLAWDMGFGFAQASLNPVTWVVLGLTLAVHRYRCGPWPMRGWGARRMAELIKVRRSQLGRARGPGRGP